VALRDGTPRSRRPLTPQSLRTRGGRSSTCPTP
jgi:hypothetical protein